MCSTSKEEYDKAINILLAYSYRTSDKDIVVEQWQCDGDCTRNYGILDFCSGEIQITKESGKKICKKFSDPLNK